MESSSLKGFFYKSQAARRPFFLRFRKERYPYCDSRNKSYITAWEEKVRKKEEIITTSPHSHHCPWKLETAKTRERKVKERERWLVVADLEARPIPQNDLILALPYSYEYFHDISTRLTPCPPLLKLFFFSKKNWNWKWNLDLSDATSTSTSTSNSNSTHTNPTHPTPWQRRGGLLTYYLTAHTKLPLLKNPAGQKLITHLT